MVNSKAIEAWTSRLDGVCSEWVNNSHAVEG